MLEKLRAITLNRRRSLLATTIVAVLGAAYLYYLASQLPASLLPGYPGDGFFPKITLMVILVCGGIILVREMIWPEADDEPETPKSDDEDDDDKTHPIQFDLIEATTIVALSLSYMILITRFGMEIMTTVFMFLLFYPRLLMPGRRAILFAAIGAVATTIFVYFAFVIGLRVPLPLAFLPRYLGQF